MHTRTALFAEFSGGSIGAPAGILIAGAHDVHIASGGRVTQHLLDSTDSGGVTRIYVEHNDRVFLEGRMQGYDAHALGRVELMTDPPSRLSAPRVVAVTARLRRAVTASRRRLRTG